MHKPLILLAFFLCYVSAYSQAYKRTHSTEIRLNTEIENSTNEMLIESTTMSSSVTLTMPANDGDTGQVLTTDGDGRLSWTEKNVTTSYSTNQYYDAYDNAGGITVGSSPITVSFDTERENPDGSVFSLSGGQVTVNLTDKFMIIYRVSIDVTSGTNRSDNTTWLERNSGSGWVEVDGFRAYGYNRQAGEGFSTNNAMGIVEVNAGDQFRVRAQRDSGSDVLETVADGSSITIFAIRNSGSGPPGPEGPEGPQGPTGTSSDYLNVFNSSSGGVTINSTAATIPYNSITNSSGTLYSLEDNAIIVEGDDEFYIQYTVSLDQTGGNNRTAWASWLEVDEGAGFSEVTGTRGTGYSRQTADGENTAMGQTIFEVSGSATFRVRAQDISSNRTLEPIANGCSFIIYTLRGGEQGPPGADGADGADGEDGAPGTASNYLNAYNNSNGGIIVNSTANTIPYNTTSNSSGTLFSLDNSGIVVDATDEYYIQYTVSMEQTNGNDRTSWQSWLELNSGSGFSEVVGTRASGYSRNNTDGEISTMGQAIVDVTATSTFRVRAQDVSANHDHEPIPNGCSFVIYTLRGGEQGPAGADGSGGSSTLTDLVQGTGNSGQVAFFNGSSSITSEAELFYDSVNNYLGIGNSSPSYSLDVNDQINVGSNGTSGSFNIYSENGVTDYFVTLTSSSLTENTSYDFPSEQGDANSILQNDGSGNLTWVSPSDYSSDLRSNVSFTGNSSATLSASSDFLVCNNTGNSITLTLPSASGLSGKTYKFKKTSATGGSNLVTILASGSETIDGSSTFNLVTQYDAVSIISDNSEWYVISKVEN